MPGGQIRINLPPEHPSHNVFRNNTISTSNNSIQMTMAFDKTHIIYVVFQSPGFYDVQRVLIADARPFLALAATLDRLTHLASISYRYRSDAKQAALLWISNFRSHKANKCIKSIFSNLWFQEIMRSWSFADFHYSLYFTHNTAQYQSHVKFQMSRQI